MASHRGSILGPLLFFLYSVDVIRIAANHGVCITHTPSLIICAYASCAATDQQTAERRLLLCIAVIHAWMSSNRLKLNADKTEFIWLGTRQQLSKVVATPLQVKDQLLQPTDAVRNLGVLIASPLTIEAHVWNVVRSCFYQLRQLRSIRRSLPTDARRTVAAAFIASLVDYSNYILYGVSSQVIRRLQMVLNAAARLVVGVGRYEHITPALRDVLHWLPVPSEYSSKQSLRLTISVSSVCLLQQRLHPSRRHIHRVPKK